VGLIGSPIIWCKSWRARRTSQGEKKEWKNYEKLPYKSPRQKKILIPPDYPPGHDPLIISPETHSSAIPRTAPEHPRQWFWPAQWPCPPARVIHWKVSCL
jgi:hypothetical protein